MRSDTKRSEGVVVYQATITSIGSQVPAFVKHGMLVFFGEGAPEELHDMSVLHRVNVAHDGPRAGDVIRIGGAEVPVLAAGSVVHDNLLNLGHIDLKADGNTEAKLPGDVCVPKGALSTPDVGDVFAIVRSAG